jgi:hypothetical protein
MALKPRRSGMPARISIYQNVLQPSRQEASTILQVFAPSTQQAYASTTTPTSGFLSYVVLHDYSLPGRTSSTSTLPCAGSTRLLAAAALHLLHHASRCLGTSRGSSRGSSRHSSSTTLPRAGSSSTTSPTPCVRVPRHVARPVTRLIVDYSVRRNFVLRPRWLYFSHTVRGDYLSRGNTGSTSSTPRAATMSSSGHIALTIHLD